MPTVDVVLATREPEVTASGIESKVIHNIVELGAVDWTDREVLRAVGSSSQLQTDYWPQTR